MHTTTFSEMLELPEGGYLIDTPGIKGFGTFDIEPEELTSYFKDISASRYQSYLSMLQDKDENKYREAY